MLQYNVLIITEGSNIIINNINPSKIEIPENGALKEFFELKAQI